MQRLDHETLEMLLIGTTALCIVFQTILISAAFLAARKAIQSMTVQFDDFKASAMPIVDHARGFVQRVTPPVEQTAKNVAEMSETLKRSTAEISETLKENTRKVSASASEIAERVNAQSTRVDAMVTGALDAVDRAAATVVQTVNKPVRQLSGLLAGARAVVEVLSSPQRPARGSAAASKPQSARDAHTHTVL